MKQTELALLKELVAKLDPGPSVSKVREPRDMFRCQSHAAFVAAFDYLITLPGYSQRSIAREMGCDHSVLGDWLKFGDKKEFQIPGWAFAALPKPGHFVFLKHMIGWGELSNIERTGTDG